MRRTTAVFQFNTHVNDHIKTDFYSVDWRFWNVCFQLPRIPQLLKCKLHILFYKIPLQIKRFLSFCINTLYGFWVRVLYRILGFSVQHFFFVIISAFSSATLLTHCFTLKNKLYLTSNNSNISFFLETQRDLSPINKCFLLLFNKVNIFKCTSLYSFTYEIQINTVVMYMIWGITVNTKLKTFNILSGAIKHVNI